MRVLPALAVLAALVVACSTAGRPAGGLTDRQRQDRPLAVAWAWDLRLAGQLWQQAYEASRAASVAQPGTAAGASAAQALRYRDLVRQMVNKEAPEPFREEARVANLRGWGNTAVSLLGEAEWLRQRAEATDDAALRRRAEERYALADAAMARYLEAARQITLAYQVDPLALPLE